MINLVSEFQKIESADETKCSTFYSKPNAELIINEQDFDDVFESIYITVISNIEKFPGKSLIWFLHPVRDHITNILKCNNLAGRNYNKLLKELDNPKKTLKGL